MWVATELIATGAFDEHEARTASRACGTDAQLEDTAAAVALARATRQRPDGREWWTEQVKEHLIKGRPIKAYNKLSQDMSEPADVVLDVWPEPDEPLKIRIPEGLAPGDTFLLGDINGRRSRATVIQKGAELGATFEPPRPNAELAGLHSAALMEAVTRLQRGI